MAASDPARDCARRPAAPAGGLGSLVATELFRPPPPAAALLAERFVARHGDCVSAVLFYGSCLRGAPGVDVPAGVLDFYVLVDRYRDAYGSRALAWANAALPPNVFYLEAETPIGRLRCKYAVISLDDFERGALPGGRRPGIWARFCQPALAVWTRDAAARQRVAAAVEEAILTAVDRVLPLLADADGVARVNSQQLWLRVLRETYAAEWRTESPETIEGLYSANPERYAAATAAALDALEKRGRLRVARAGARYELEPLGERSQRPIRRPIGKLLYFAALLKSIATFGDWLPYALWKLERHTGTRIELTDRQRRHPLIWGWPVLWRVLRQRDLR